MVRLRKFSLWCLISIVVLACLHIYVAPASAEVAVTEEEGWIKNPSNGHYYKLTTPMNWLQAEAQAVEWGGHLVTINDREEELWLRDRFGAHEYFWIGFNDIRAEGNWEWVSGEPVTYTNWWEGEPNNQSGDGRPEDAAIMNWGGSEQIDGEWISYYGDGWNDVPIDGGARGIVEVTELPKLFVVIPGVGFGKIPEHGELMLERAKVMFRYDYECLVEIFETPYLSDGEILDMITEATRKAKEKGKDVIVNIDMDLDGFSLAEYINPFSKRWKKSVEWAGRMANIVSEAFNKENPTGSRMLYAHSAGVDATTQSIQQRPDKRIYDDLNLFNGRTKAPILASSLKKSGYSAWQVKVFTSDEGVFLALPNSLSNYDAARRRAGKAWVHLHSLTITGHNGLRDAIGVEGTFEVMGPFGRYDNVVGTVEEMMLWDWQAGCHVR